MNNLHVVRAIEVTFNDAYPVRSEQGDMAGKPVVVLALTDKAGEAVNLAMLTTDARTMIIDLLLSLEAQGDALSRAILDGHFRRPAQRQPVPSSN